MGKEIGVIPSICVMRHTEDFCGYNFAVDFPTEIGRDCAVAYITNKATGKSLRDLHFRSDNMADAIVKARDYVEGLKNKKLIHAARKRRES